MKPMIISDPYRIFTKKMIDAATEIYDFDYYKNNSNFYTYGNRHNYYTYNTTWDQPSTLDYIVYREPKLQDMLEMKVIDYR